MLRCYRATIEGCREAQREGFKCDPVAMDKAAHGALRFLRNVVLTQNMIIRMGKTYEVLRP